MSRQKQNKPKQKSNDQYRRDIFILKTTLKQQQHHLEQLQQKSSQLDIFTPQSYTFQTKIKILQNDLSTIRDRIHKYSKDKYSKYYRLNFCVYALGRACTVVGIAPEMVYRCVDVEGRGVVGYQALMGFLRDVLRMDTSLVNPILVQLDYKQNQTIELTRYTKLLKCFAIDTQLPQSHPQTSQQQNPQPQPQTQLNESLHTVSLQLLKSSHNPTLLWTDKLLNIAIVPGGLKAKLPKLDTLDCVAVYCRCDPNREGVVECERVVGVLEKCMKDMGRFKGTLSGVV